MTANSAVDALRRAAEQATDDADALFLSLLAGDMEHLLLIQKQGQANREDAERFRYLLRITSPEALGGDVDACDEIKEWYWQPGRADLREIVDRVRASHPGLYPEAP